MGKLSPKVFRLKAKIQLRQEELARKAVQAENELHQRLLDQFCVKLGDFLLLFQDDLADQVRSILFKAGVNHVLPIVPENGAERRRRYIDFDAAIQNCIRICAGRVPVDNLNHIIYPVPPPVSVDALVPKIKQEIRDAIGVYRNLDRLYHLAFTQDENNLPKKRVSTLIDEIKQLPVPDKMDALGRLRYQLLSILNNNQLAGELLQAQGLYARQDGGVRPDKPVKHRNKAVRL